MRRVLGLGFEIVKVDFLEGLDVCIMYVCTSRSVPDLLALLPIRCTVPCLYSASLYFLSE